MSSGASFELEGGHSQVHEDPVDARAGTALLGHGLVDAIVGRVDRAEAAPESFEASGGKRDSLRVTVDTDNGQLVEALERALGVTAHP